MLRRVRRRLRQRPGRRRHPVDAAQIWAQGRPGDGGVVRDDALQAPPARCAGSPTVGWQVGSGVQVQVRGRVGVGAGVGVSLGARYVIKPGMHG